MSDRSSAPAGRNRPLDGLALPKGDAFSITAMADAARFILRGAAGLATAFGPAAPKLLGSAEKGSRVTLTIGPDEFLLIAPGEDAVALRRELETALAAELHSLVDVSHRQIGLVLTGRLATRCLSTGCPLDLRLTAFPVGMATRTIFLEAEIVLRRLAEDRFHVEVWRSFAPYLVGHLTEALTGAEGL